MRLINVTATAASAGLENPLRQCWRRRPARPWAQASLARYKQVKRFAQARYVTLAGTVHRAARWRGAAAIAVSRCAPSVKLRWISRGPIDDARTWLPTRSKRVGHGPQEQLPCPIRSAWPVGGGVNVFVGERERRHLGEAHLGGGLTSRWSYRAGDFKRPTSHSSGAPQAAGVGARALPSSRSRTVASGWGRSVIRRSRPGGLRVSGVTSSGERWGHPLPAQTLDLQTPPSKRKSSSRIA